MKNSLIIYYLFNFQRKKLPEESTAPNLSPKLLNFIVFTTSLLLVWNSAILELFEKLNNSMKPRFAVANKGKFGWETINWESVRSVLFLFNPVYYKLKFNEKIQIKNLNDKNEQKNSMNEKTQLKKNQLNKWTKKLQWKNSMKKFNEKIQWKNSMKNSM